MIDRIRYVLAVLHIIILPPGVLFWLIIHPWAGWWRRLGPVWTYLMVVPVSVALGVVLFRFRGPLLGMKFETNLALLATAFVLYSLLIWLEFQYWKQLSFAIVAGIPELSPIGDGKGILLRDGIYRVVRHPRYLSAGLGILANAFFINYAGLYFLILLLVPVGYVLLKLEERELIDRFGEEYRKYQREVPGLIPRWGKPKGK